MMELGRLKTDIVFASEYFMTALARPAEPKDTQGEADLHGLADVHGEANLHAEAISRDHAESHAEADSAGFADVRLSSLLAATADRHPARIAFADQPNREDWSGRPRIAWTYANTQHIVERLATALSALELPPGSPVAICLPNGSEAAVTLLAVERAGYIPCMLPIGWSEEVLGKRWNRCLPARSSARVVSPRNDRLTCVAGSRPVISASGSFAPSGRKCLTA